MKMKWQGWLLCGLLLLPVGGCVTGVDPVTGEKTYAVDPNNKVVLGAEAAAQGATAVGGFFGPVGGLIAGIAAGALGAWRQIKPKLLQARTKAAHYYATAAATVEGIEQFKTASPESWTLLGEKIGEQLTKQGVDPKVIDNVIRALRGLPEKA